MYSGTYTKRMLDRDTATREAQSASARRLQSIRDAVAEIKSRKGAEYVQCNCDLDNWEPERSTGHSWVCRIHKMAILKAGAA